MFYFEQYDSKHLHETNHLNSQVPTTVYLACRVRESPSHSSQQRPERGGTWAVHGKASPALQFSAPLYHLVQTEQKIFPVTEEKSQGSCRQELTWYSWLPYFTALPAFRAFLSQQHSQGNIISPSNLCCCIQRTPQNSTKGFIWLPYLPLSAASWESAVLNLKFLLPFKPT